MFGKKKTVDFGAFVEGDAILISLSTPAEEAFAKTLLNDGVLKQSFEKNFSCVILEMKESRLKILTKQQNIEKLYSGFGYLSEEQEKSTVVTPGHISSTSILVKHTELPLYYDSISCITNDNTPPTVAQKPSLVPIFKAVRAHAKQVEEAVVNSLNATAKAVLKPDVNYNPLS